MSLYSSSFVSKFPTGISVPTAARAANTRVSVLLWTAASEQPLRLPASRISTLYCVMSDSAAESVSSFVDGKKDAGFDGGSDAIKAGNGVEPVVDGGGGDGDDRNFGGNGGGDGGDEDPEETEFGPILKFEEVMREAEARGVKLPSDMLEAAKTLGIRKLFLFRYLDLQVVISLPC